MGMTPIKFGTDGWRALIAEDFTFENVRYCAQGTADYLSSQGLAGRDFVVGYDTRFLSSDFAAAVAEVAAANGIKTLLCDRAAPTPVVSYNVVHRRAGSGMVITASHNPGEWNGIKFKPDYGGSASPEVATELESHIAAAQAEGRSKRMELSKAVADGLVEHIDPERVYLDHLASVVDLGPIKAAGLNVVADSMHGAGGGYYTRLLSGGATMVTELRSEPNPAFPGMDNPEPLAHNLAPLVDRIKDSGADVGIANDGDADRVGIVDEHGRFVTTLEVFSLICLYELEVRGRRGPLVRSITMSSMVDALGDLYDVPVFDTPVGFKFVGQKMMEEDALLAGEESGGYAFKDNLPERDGVLSGLVVLDMMVKTGKSVSELVDMLMAKVGPHHYDRLDVHLRDGQRPEIEERIRAADPDALAGRRVVDVDTRDGYRYTLEGGFWSLVRFSGTEPLLRIYAEADSPEGVEALLNEVRSIAGV